MEDPASCNFFASQFKKSCLGLKYDPSTFLATAQCGRAHKLYIFYRAMWAAYWCSLLLYDWTSVANNKWPIYLTNWSYMMLSISSVLQLACSVYHAAYWHVYSSNETPIVYKINWVVYNYSSVAALLVTIMYWATLYEGGGTTFMNTAVHLINSLYVMIDIWVTGVPVRIFHFWHSEIYGIIYLIFSLIHWGAGGDPIYPILDYSNDPTTAALCIVILALVGVPVFQLILFCCHWLRVLLYSKCCKPVTGSTQISDEQLNKMENGLAHDNQTFTDESVHI